jgi:hypothetical protein
VPRERRVGGRRVVEVDIMVDLPMLIAVLEVLLLLLLDPPAAVVAVAEDDLEVLVVESAGLVRVRSPRRWVSDMRTVRPARVMLGVPDIKARRDTLLPES